MKQMITIFTAILLNCVTGCILGSVIGIPPLWGALGMNAAALIFKLPVALNMGVFKEIWTGELVKSLRAFFTGSWLDGVPDNTNIVDNDVIHLVEVGVDPDVLINNTTYPIPLQALDDADITISLDKFQTKVTPITDDELHAISYDKIARVKESHANSLSDAEFTKAAHALCGQNNTETTPVLKTTGSRDAVTGRHVMKIKDVIAMKAAMDKLKVPTDHRRLVLCPDHVNDLLSTDQSFKEQYNINRADGRIGRLYGFDIYECGLNPYYTTEGEKKAVGEDPESGEFQCSFAFYVPRVFKATGSTKMYYSEAATDPEYQRNKINFRQYFICMPKKADAGCVMTSDYSAS